MINLSHEESVIESSIIDYNIIKIIDDLLNEKFTQNSNSASESHYSKPSALENYELRLLHEILLLTASLS